MRKILSISAAFLNAKHALRFLFPLLLISQNFALGQQGYLSTAIGYESQAPGYGTTAIGWLSYAASYRGATAIGYLAKILPASPEVGWVYGSGSIAIGRNVAVQMGIDVPAIAIGSGVVSAGYDYNALVNTIGNSIMLGCNSNIPTLFVGPSNGANTTGNVGIGTTSPSEKLTVKGKILASEVKVVALETIPDFVFNDDFKLRPLAEVEAFVKQYKHLPDIPSEKDIRADGVALGEMQLKLLQKIEELTLYLIAEKKQTDALKKENNDLKQRYEQLEQRLKALESASAR